MILDSCMYDARMVHASMMRTFLGTDILLMGGAAAAAGANRGTMGLGFKVLQFWLFHDSMQNETLH